MRRKLYKFPHTPYLAWLGDRSLRGEKILSPGERIDFLNGDVVVEEKVDGANVGIGFDSDLSPSVWNRGTTLSAGAHPQFQAFWPWLAQRRDSLADALGTDLILFGEWCFAVHSIRYDRLPDYFLAIDIYDCRAGRFWSSGRRDEWARKCGITSVPTLAKGGFTLDELRKLLTSSSRLGPEPLEGLYLRREEGDWLLDRAKLVRPEFTQAIEEHWMSRPMEKNTVLRSQC